MWISCDVSVFRRPSDIRVADSVRAAGVEITCLDTAALTRENLFSVGFDDVLARLAGLVRTDVEPDGFFVRTGQAAGRYWQLNGHLFELGEWLWRVDLRGEGPRQALDEVLLTLGWPETPLVYQLIPLGVTVDEADFRHWAQRRTAQDLH
jgi:hypothetical protein